jgi:protein involved in polysaccharide export with SLBB domain
MRLLLALTCALLILSCRGPRSGNQANNLPMDQANTAPRESEASTLGPGDVVEVRVFQEADLSGAYRVSPDGTIDYPLCGKVTLANFNSSQAADALNKCLSNGFLRNPSVSVLIREYNSKKVFVFGEVNKPGTFAFDSEMSIIQAVTLAGGFTKVAAKNSINVTRLIDGNERKIRVPVEDIGVGREKNFFLQPGDIVFVPESFF